jgi:hypothetical protein
MEIEKLLTDESLDFARRHLTSYYDTDFFPKPYEFSAIWHKWEELKSLPRKELLALVPPVTLPWKKSKGGFRVVHQLDPLDALVYTAATYSVAEQVEKARKAQAEAIACSYRIRLDGNGFFRSGSGFEVYRDRCESLADEYDYVLTTDISDFYNKIYLHRLENAISNATNSTTGKPFEKFLMALNTHNSQGIPVGPAASIIMSEATLIDVDDFISHRSFQHVRYVDDIRIFSNSALELDILLQELTLYLHQTHRLGLVAEKTKILESKVFLQEELNNQYQLDKLEILETIETTNPYTFDGVIIDEGNDEEELSDEEIGVKLLDALKRIEKYEHLDLALARAILRRARAGKVFYIAKHLLTNLRQFRAVINDVVLYLEAVTNDENIPFLIPMLVDVALSGDFEDKAINEWFSWYISNHRKLLDIKELRAVFVYSTRLSYAARAAVNLKNTSWVRERKENLQNSTNWDRRAIIYASQLMAEEEKKKWLEPLRKKASFNLLDKWMIDWVLAGAPETPPLPTPILPEESLSSEGFDWEDFDIDF